MLLKLVEVWKLALAIMVLQLLLVAQLVHTLIFMGIEDNY
jgi:hypothetical protein